MLWKSDTFLATVGNRHIISQLRRTSASHFTDWLFRVTQYQKYRYKIFIVLIGFWTFYMSYNVSKMVPILTILENEQSAPPFQRKAILQQRNTIARIT